MHIIKKYVSENSTLLFKHHVEGEKLAILDNKGFYFSDETQKKYDLIKNQPHIYVAWTKNAEGSCYIGKSFQNGGRWKRQHAYHLGTLAHHLLGTIRNDDQNHAHWIKLWMNSNTLKAIDFNNYLIELNVPVYICFIPFSLYSNQNLADLSKPDIRKVNTDFEKQLIKVYKDDNLNLLNIQNN